MIWRDVELQEYDQKLIKLILVWVKTPWKQKTTKQIHRKVTISRNSPKLLTHKHLLSFPECLAPARVRDSQHPAAAAAVRRDHQWIRFVGLSLWVNIPQILSNSRAEKKESSATKNIFKVLAQHMWHNKYVPVSKMAFFEYFFWGFLPFPRVIQKAKSQRPCEISGSRYFVRLALHSLSSIYSSRLQEPWLKRQLEAFLFIFPLTL